MTHAEGSDREARQLGQQGQPLQQLPPALDKQLPRQREGIFAKLTPNYFREMDEIISSLESTYDCAMTQHKSAPDDKEKEKRYKDSRKLLDRWEMDRRYARHELLEAHMFVTSQQRQCKEWDKDGNTEQLECYIQALYSQKELIRRLKPRSLIKLAGALWHANSFCAMDTLYVRDVYTNLMQARHAGIKAFDLSESSSTTVFSGSPGVGTSCFGSVFMAQMLLNGKNVLLECGEETPCLGVRHYYWLPSSGGVEHTCNWKLAVERLKQSNSPSVYIVDGCQAGIGEEMWQGETVVFCNLHPRLWRKDEKSLIFVVPPASLEELWTMSQTLPKYKGMEAGSVLQWHSWAGGNIAACLDTNSFGPQELHLRTDRVDRALTMATAGDMQDVTHPLGLEGRVAALQCIIHWGPAVPVSATSSPEGMLHMYGNPCLRFASDTLQEVAIREVDPRAMTVLASTCLDQEGADHIYWMEILRDSVEVNSEKARISMCGEQSIAQGSTGHGVVHQKVQACT